MNLFTISQAEKRLGMAYQSLQRYVQKGYVSPQTVNGRKYFTLEDLNWLRWVRRNYERHGIQRLGFNSDFIGISEAAKRLNVTRQTIYRWLKRNFAHILPLTKGLIPKEIFNSWCVKTPKKHLGINCDES